MKHTICILLGIFISLCISIFPWFKISPSDEFEPYVPPVPVEEEILSNMSIQEKVGQLFMFGFDGTTLSAQTKQFFTDIHLGGVLLLGKNISDEIQLKNLVTDIQSTNTIPLFVSIDQEGGVVSRIRWNETLTKAQSDVGSREDAYSLAVARGEMLKSYGINMNLAPVVEYITDEGSFLYNRVYRGSKEEVMRKSIGSVQGYTKVGVISVVKHYPGHGNYSSDSHFDLPVVDISNDQWSEYIDPFVYLLRDSDALMVGHILFSNIDSDPSTISDEILTKRLIEDLEYEGLIISDDMHMDALDDIDTYPNIARRALEAGNDILIYSSNFSNAQVDVYNYIVQEVTNGSMNIDEKVLKILRIKLKYDILETEGD